MNVCALKSRLWRTARGKTGAVVVEYLFLILFIVLVSLIGIKTFGTTVNNAMGSNNNSVVASWQ
jgi:Flp pilus assembly pilin Flp